MSKLRPEYEKIVDDVWQTMGPDMYSKLIEVATRCQELADKPPKELTDEYIGGLWARYWRNPDPKNMPSQMGPFIEWLLLTDRQKAKEPEVVKVNVSVYRKTNGEIIARCNHESLFVDAKLLKTETLEVTLP